MAIEKERNFNPPHENIMSKFGILKHNFRRLTVDFGSVKLNPHINSTNFNKQ